MTKKYVQENFLVLSMNVFHEVREPGLGRFWINLHILKLFYSLSQNQVSKVYLRMFLPFLSERDCQSSNKLCGMNSNVSNRIIKSF